MELTFTNPGIDNMLEHILGFQGEDEFAFWSEPLYHFYPQLDRSHAKSLPFDQRMQYMEDTLRQVYPGLKKTVDQKVLDYQAHWEAHKDQITAALSDAFGVDCTALFNDMRCNVSLNPIEPRFLAEHSFDIFYRNSHRGAIGEAIHEIIHFVWFHVWNRLFADAWEEYERPHLKWVLSEMVVESVMRDPRLSSINPYFPREQGGCIYPYFFDMRADGKPILETLDEMYRRLPIEAFMLQSYAYCQAHEEEIRSHIAAAEAMQ